MSGLAIEVRCHWCGGTCNVLETLSAKHYVWCDGCAASGPLAPTIVGAVNAWLKVRGKHSALPLADGMRVRLLADPGWIAGRVPAGTLGTIRLRRAKVRGSNVALDAGVDWDGVAPRGGCLGGDLFGLGSSTWFPHFVELVDPHGDDA